MEGLIFSEDVCRLCLWRSNKLMPIFSDEGELQGIPMKIGMCLPISVSREDGLPKLICSRCVYKLEMFSEFRNSCVRSEQLLKRYTVHETPGPSQTTPLHVQQSQYQQTQQPQMQHVQPIQQVEPCHSLIMQTTEGLKVEVLDADSVPVVSNAPFMCVIPEEPVDAVDATSESQPVSANLELCTPVIESVNSISTGTEARNVITDTTAHTSEAKAAGVNRRKVLKRTPALKKSGNPDPLALKRTLLKNGTAKERRSSNPTVTARRNMHKCKHCSKCFPSRMRLSRHLTSSNCLFRYTCRYCAKIFGSAENRIQHERNHQDKKNFICRVCKQKFQSSFDLHVHVVQGCQKPAAVNVQSAVLKKTETKKQQIVQGKNNIKINGTNQAKKGVGGTAKSKVSVPLKCKYCNKVYSHRLPYQKHVRSCSRSVTMQKMHDSRRSVEVPNTNLTNLTDTNPGTAIIKEQGNRRSRRVYNDGVRVRPPSRRKQNSMEMQDTKVMDNPMIRNPEISPKASLLAVLGLKEKPSPPEVQLASKQDESMKFRASPDIIIEDEVVTVCDICRKIFTSEAGMLNHQISVHNRNMTTEKIHSLMRVEI